MSRKKPMKLTDTERKQIVADATNGESFRSIARRYDVSATTVRNICHADISFAQKCAQKKEENTVAVLEHMTRQKGKVCSILGRILEEFEKPGRLEDATITQLATTLGILVDKYTADEARTMGVPQENNIFEVIDQSTKEELDTSEISEIEPPAEPGNDLVE